MKKPEKPQNEKQFQYRDFGRFLTLQDLLNYTAETSVPADKINVEAIGSDYPYLECSYYEPELPEEEFQKKLNKYKKDLEKYEKYLEDTKEQREKEEAKKQETLRKARLKKLKAEQRTLKAAITRLEKEIKG